MSDQVRHFCVAIHEKLSSLESRVESLKMNSGLTWHHLQERLDEVRVKGDAHQRSLDQSRTLLGKWFDDKSSELRTKIESWMQSRDVHHLTERAQRTEEYAFLAMEIAESSIDNAERMILEAISARLDAESVGSDDNDDDLSPEVRQSILNQPNCDESHPTSSGGTGYGEDDRVRQEPDADYRSDGS